jgi:hypothetical protein
MSSKEVVLAKRDETGRWRYYVEEPLGLYYDFELEEDEEVVNE